MFKAYNEKKEWIEVTYSGQKAFCPSCNETVIGKIYYEKRSHFSHLPSSICSINNGDITDWHLQWQSIFDCKEVRFPEKGLRADVVLKNGTVLEFQHSDIDFKEIRRREQGYKRMIWLFDCTQVKDERFFIDGEFYYWHYPKINWLLYSKPAFFQFDDNLIIQLRDIDFILSENKGGYPMKIMKANTFKILTENGFISEALMMDNLPIKDFNISQNINQFKP